MQCVCIILVVLCYCFDVYTSKQKLRHLIVNCLGECAIYQPAIDQSDWPIQTVIIHENIVL